MTRLSARYHPLRALVGWTVIAAGAWFVARGYAAASAADPAAEGGLAGAYLARLLASPFQEAMLVLLGGTLLYCVAQVPALRRDARVLSRPPTRAPAGEGGDALRAVAAGRAADFWRAPENDWSRAEHLRSWATVMSRPLTLLVWVFPMLGFLGTVVGLSFAVAALGDQAMTGGALSADALAPVLAGLDTAFDTTIQGIVSALVLAGAATALDLRWEALRLLVDAQARATLQTASVDPIASAPPTSAKVNSKTKPASRPTASGDRR